MIPIYRPLDSVIHRISAGIKLLLLMVAGTSLFFIDSLWVHIVFLLFVAGGYVLARLGLPTVLTQIKALFWLILLVLLIQLLFSGWYQALIVSLRLLSLILLASLVTLTTRTTDMISVLTTLLSPLARLGLPVHSIGMMLSLVIRYIPLLMQQYQLLSDAHTARGGGRNTLVLIVPLLVKSLQLGDQLAQSIDARSYPPSDQTDEAQQNHLSP